MNQPLALAVALTALVFTACRPAAEQNATNTTPASPDAATASTPGGPVDACRLALLPRSGSQPADREIAALQGRVREPRRPAEALQALEKLGWLYVREARRSFDPGFYSLAEQCAICLDSKDSGSLEALFLRAYALHGLHRFREAEPLARELVRQRGAPFDHGLLGDVLLDLGRLDETLTAYQTMMDLKPDLHAYVRAAHLRWLAGFVPEAIELLDAAAAAASPRDPEGAAWVWTRLAQLQFQAGAREESRHGWTTALAFQSNYAPALLLRGRCQLAEGNATSAVESLRRAAELNPLPEYEWALSEALRSAGRIEEARRVEDRLRTRGAAEDPRTVALYLATRGEDTATAVGLARRELEQRADVFTHDALAWALTAAGQVEAARQPMTRALAHGTQDARLFLHAAVIATRSGQIDEARSWAAKAAALRHLLLPSEQEHLARLPLATGAPPLGQTFSTARR